MSLPVMELAPLATLLIAFILVENGSFGQRQVEKISSKPSKSSQLTKNPTKTTPRATFKPLTTKKTLILTTKRIKNQPLKQKTTVKISTIRTTKSSTSLKKTTTKYQQLKETYDPLRDRSSWTETVGDEVLVAALDSIVNFPSYDDYETISTELLELVEPPEKDQQTLNGTDATTEFYEDLEYTTPMGVNVSSTIDANLTTTTRKKLKRRKTTTPGLPTRKKLKRRRTTAKASD